MTSSSSRTFVWPPLWASLGLAIVGGLGCFFLGNDRFVADELHEVLGHRLLPFLLCLGLATLGSLLGARHWYLLARERAHGTRINRGSYSIQVGLAVLSTLTGSLFTWFGIAITFTASAYENVHGRRLRRFRKVHVPQARRGAWRASSPRPEECILHIDAPEELRARLATAWRETGCKEHAAIASFAQLSLDLLAVGAPPYLLDITHADASDEIRHAALCFAIARAFDGEDHGPAPFPAARLLRPLATCSRSLALIQIAIDSLHDGVLNEGMSARILARLAERAADPQLAHHLRAMAVDEARHASHSWRVVEWCLEEGGEHVRRAVHAAARHLPARMKADLDAAAASGAWERWGLQGQSLERACFERARSNAVRKLRTITATAAHIAVRSAA
jgi:rubrerythrin